MIILTFKDSEKKAFNKILSAIADEPKIIMANSDLAIYCTNLTIWPDKHQVVLNEKEVHLTHLEFSCLIYLARHPGRVFTKEQIYQHVYNSEIMGEIDNLIYCLIRSLRKKLELDPRNPQYIVTVRGVGYKFVK